MKAEITRTRLVEQPSTERPQSQIVSVILIHSPPQTLALIFFCVFPLHALFLYIISVIFLEFPHFFSLILFLSRSLLWLLCCSKHEIHLNSFQFSTMSAFAVTYFSIFLACTVSSLFCLMCAGFFFPPLSPAPCRHGLL